LSFHISPDYNTPNGKTQQDAEPVPSKYAWIEEPAWKQVLGNRRAHSQGPHSMNSSSNFLFCAICGTQNMLPAKFCKQCGRELVGRPGDRRAEKWMLWLAGSTTGMILLFALCLANSRSNAEAGSMFFTILFISAVMSGFVYCAGNVMEKIGVPRWIGILAILPAVNVILFVTASFVEWPIQKRVRDLEKRIQSMQPDPKVG
jgi:hypothetical protein